MKKGKEIFFYVLGVSIVVGFFVVISFLIYKGGFESTVNILIGTLAGSFVSVVSFFYGSTKGSQEKTEMIYNSKPINNDNPT